MNDIVLKSKKSCEKRKESQKSEIKNDETSQKYVKIASMFIW